MPTNKYVQLHPTTEATNEIDESVNLYPVIGPDSFKDFVPSSDPEVFKPQEKLVSGTNIKSITIGNDINTLLQESAAPAGTLNLNSYLLNLIYPVGSIYMSTVANENDEDVCPIAVLGGTWERIKDRFLWAKGDEDTLGDTAGSKDAVNVLHTHTIYSTNLSTTRNKNLDIEFGIGNTEVIMGLWGKDTSPLGWKRIYEGDRNVDNFLYGISGWTGGDNPVSIRSEIQLDNYVSLKKVSNNSGYSYVLRDTNWNTLNNMHNKAGFKLRFDLNHEHTIPSHTHSMSSDGVNGEGKNMPPYLVVMAWKRVA
jgi:hypothetical protein